MKEQLLRRAAELIALDEPTESDVCRLFNVARKLIERLSKEEKQEFALLNFYCDWTMHIEISGADPAAVIIEEIQTIYRENRYQSDGEFKMEGGIAKAFSFATLREQLEKLLQKVEKDPSIKIDMLKWHAIQLHLRTIIADCPLKIGRSDSHRQTLERLKENPARGDLHISKVELSKIGNHIPDDPEADWPMIDLTFSNKDGKEIYGEGFTILHP